MYLNQLQRQHIVQQHIVVNVWFCLFYLYTLYKDYIPQPAETSGTNSPQGDLLFSKVKIDLIQGKKEFAVVVG